MIGFLVDVLGWIVLGGLTGVAVVVVGLGTFYSWRKRVHRRRFRERIAELPEHRRVYIYLQALESGADPREVANTLSIEDPDDLDPEVLDRAISFEDRDVLEEMMGGACEACGRSKDDATLLLRPDGYLLCLGCMAGSEVS